MDDVSHTKKMHVGVIDFFCGSGGTSCGFQQARIPGTKISIIAGIDHDAQCCATYERMIGAPAEQLDIRELADSDSALRAAVKRWDPARFDKLVVIGCAPCQGFAAHRKSITTRDVRRSLFVAFCKMVTKLNPDLVLMENVPDLFSRKHWPYYKAGKDTLESNGFSVRSRVYNFAGFGLPQERFRAVMVACKQPFNLPEPKLEPEKFVTVRSAIGHLPPLGPGERSASDPMHVVSAHRPSTVKIISQVPKDGGNRPLGVGPKCLDRARLSHGGYTDVYGRLSWSRPSVTLTGKCRTPSAGRFAHPEQNRGLSVREAALLQGFPSDYQFEGTFDGKFLQVGNAVPPVVAKCLAEHLIQLLKKRPRDIPAGADEIQRPVGHGFAITINGIKRRRASEQKKNGSTKCN